MKIAFVDNLPVFGGLSRFSYVLCKNLAQIDNSIYIDYYTHANNLKRTPELLSLPENVNIKILDSTVTKDPIFLTIYERIHNRIIRTIGFTKLLKQPTPAQYEDDTILEIEQRVTDYDVAYFTAAHMIKRPKLNIPIVGTIHDFNWKYFFGRQIFPLSFVTEMDGDILDWLENSFTISSSNDVVNEANKLYPGLKRYPEVVHIAPVTFSENVTPEHAQKILDDLEINYPYIIFPGNFYPHKNHFNLFAAFALLKKREGFKSLKLILTGMNSDQVPYAIAEKLGIQLVTINSPNKDFDIRGLGYQPNNVIEVLIKNATLLVSPSIYEAICTPAMDAWFFGTPTAISDIPPFREHEAAWGIRSAYFDPTDIENIADTLEKYINNPEEAKKDGMISKENISKYSWDIVAKKYLEVFNKAINHKV